MINLIPNEEKKKKVKDFYFRLIVVSLTAVGISLLIGSVAIMPTLILSSVKKSGNVSKLQILNSEPLPEIDAKKLAGVKELGAKLDILDRNMEDKYMVSKNIVNEIILKKMQDIKITEITYQNTPTGKTVSISGEAGSRERLLLFRRALEDDTLFKKVDLPISNFTKGSNIKFSLSLIPF